MKRERKASHASTAPSDTSSCAADLPGDNLVVEGADSPTELAHAYAGWWPQPCIDKCLATRVSSHCYGFVTVDNVCYFRGGLTGLQSSPEALAASRVPAGQEYTLYVIYPDMALVGLALLAIGCFILCFSASVP